MWAGLCSDYLVLSTGRSCEASAIFLPMLQMERLRHSQAVAELGSEPRHPGFRAWVLNHCPQSMAGLSLFLSPIRVKNAACFVPCWDRLSSRLIGSGVGCLLLGCGSGMAGVLTPTSREARSGCSQRKPGLRSLVEQEQLLMTFRKKLMMRNASWHFRSASEQPHVSTHRRGRDGGWAWWAGEQWQELILLCQ